ncbi:MAG TPA: hypothetical protein DCZ01_10990 [Elusimicrobia bacterium]|nr:MAG: hypothetical protein A2X37_01980 [Elusimicrobia bacterium GWA2_66_18]OGR77428.1 MAG: hypothetical protein A2X40_11255 [Elusimicrobia bacterium GWC2_65_9]HAZ09016.1 hypothetical protein [Elusimicrobiota bacterium]
MEVAPMQWISRRALLALGALWLAGCAATSPRVVKIDAPGAIQEENSYAGEELYLTKFAVKNKASVDTKEAEEALKEQFIAYLRDGAKFGKIIDATFGAQVPPDALKLETEFTANMEGGDISFMAGMYQAYLLFSISPRKGSAIVIGSASLLRKRKVLSQRSWTSSQPFSFIFFGMFRTGPIQAAYKAAYEDAFNHIVVPVGSDNAPAVSKAELQSLVKAGIAEASKKAEPIYNSDVDKPAYALPENADNFALVMGIEKYASIAQADFAERDAGTVKEHLYALGYPRRNVVYLTGNMVTRGNMEKYVESWLPGKVTEDSKVFVYFSGHGSPGISTGEAYLVPWDGDVKFLENTGYPLKRLYARLNALKARKVIVALDSCFSGAGGRSVIPKGTRPLVGKIDTGSGAIGRVVVLSASESSEISGSEESQGHGLFTYHLLKGLNGRKGAASLKELYDYLTPRVQDAARQQNRDQTPQLTASDEDGALTLRD